jgi:hypothetical protein
VHILLADIKAPSTQPCVNAVSKYRKSRLLTWSFVREGVVETPVFKNTTMEVSLPQKGKRAQQALLEQVVIDFKSVYMPVTSREDTGPGIFYELVDCPYYTDAKRECLFLYLQLGLSRAELQALILSSLPKKRSWLREEVDRLVTRIREVQDYAKALADIQAERQLYYPPRMAFPQGPRHEPVPAKLHLLPRVLLFPWGRLNLNSDKLLFSRLTRLIKRYSLDKLNYSDKAYFAVNESTAAKNNELRARLLLTRCMYMGQAVERGEVEFRLRQCLPLRILCHPACETLTQKHIFRGFTITATVFNAQEHGGLWLQVCRYDFGGREGFVRLDVQKSGSKTQLVKIVLAQTDLAHYRINLLERATLKWFNSCTIKRLNIKVGDTLLANKLINHKVHLLPTRMHRYVHRHWVLQVEAFLAVVSEHRCVAGGCCYY